MEFIRQSLIQLIGFAYELLSKGVKHVLKGSDLALAGQELSARQMVNRLDTMEQLMNRMRRRVLPAAITEASEEGDLKEAEGYYQWLITAYPHPEEYDHLRKGLDIEHASLAWELAYDEANLRGMQEAVAKLTELGFPQNELDDMLDRMDWMKAGEQEREAIRQFNVSKNINDVDWMERAYAMLVELDSHHRQLPRWKEQIESLKNCQKT